MAEIGAISTPLCLSSSPITESSKSTLKNRFCSPVNSPKSSISLLHAYGRQSLSLRTLPTCSHFSFSPRASSSPSVGTTEYTVEPITKVKFQSSVSLPGSSTSLLLLGTGYREKVFAIVGVKVYAAGLYVDQSIFTELEAWRGRSASEVQKQASLFDTIFQTPLEKSLQIVLVRDVDGKTFWDALDDAISPRIRSLTPSDESALSTFRNIFQGRALKKATFIFLRWINPTKLLVSVSSDGLPTTVDATIESINVSSALFDVFLGDAPISPSLKTSVAEGLSEALK